MDRVLTAKVQSEVLNNGMDLVGFAPVDRWEHAPYLLSPQAILPDSKTVIVAAIHITDTWTEMGGEPDPQTCGPGGWMDQNSLLDRIAYRTVRLLNDHGQKAIAVASSNIWRYREYEGIPSLFAPDLSHMHAAVAAGLGEMIWTGLTATPEFGPRVRFISIVTDAELVPTPMYDGPELCDKCMDCVKCCPSFAMKKDMNGSPHVVNIGGKTYKYANKNIWRCAWAEHFNLDLDSKTLSDVEHIDESVVTRELAEKGYRGHERGVCQKICIPPHLRSEEPSFGREDKKITMKRINRRYGDNMPTLRKMRDDLTAAAVEMGVDMVSVAPLQPDTEAGKRVLREAPGMKTVFAIAIRFARPACSDSQINRYNDQAFNYVAWMKKHHILLRLARKVEDYGYHAASYGLPELVGMTDLATVQGDTFETAEFGDDTVVGAIVTDAPLDPTPETTPQKPAAPRKLSPQRLRRKLEALAEQNLVSLFGVADAGVFDKVVKDLKANVDEAQLSEGIEDADLKAHGKWVSKIVDDNVKIAGPGEYVDGAKSVIVLGMHTPREIVENSGLADSQQIGTYGYWTYQTRNELRFAAFELTRLLDQQGYKTFTSENLLGIGSLMDSPRLFLPDARCNAVEAMAAGLGEISKNGTLLTPEYGPYQRAIVIVTDAELPTDKPYDGSKVCVDCDNCVSKCPMQAHQQESFSIRIGQQVVAYPKIGRHRCDWAKRYSLHKDEGPELIGNTTHVEPSHDGPITIEEVAAACEQKDEIMKKRSCILEPCLRHCKAGCGA